GPDGEGAVAVRTPRCLPARGVVVEAGQAGDVVDRAAHRTHAMEEARRPADRLHPFVLPRVHRARGDGGVLHVDAVEQLADLACGKAAPSDGVAMAGR